MAAEDNDRTKRAFFHDYHDRCVYLVTVTVVDRKPLLGKVEGDVRTATVELTPLGRAVSNELWNIPKRYPQVRLMQYVVMPDHVHFILYVTERLPQTLALGNIVASWKAACSKAYRDLKVATLDAFGNALCAATFRSPAEAAMPPAAPLFDKGFNDSILHGQEQLNHMMVYVRDNPRRLHIKRQHSPFFVIHRDLQVAGYRFDAVGNQYLLQRPMVAVHCRRHWSEAEQQAYAQQCQAASEQGAVLIGPFISKAERSILHEAQERERPVIHLQENGFAALYKPVGNDFYACAEGCLLQLAPWPYHNDSHPISREQCNAMNLMAETIANTSVSCFSYEKRE